MAYSTHVHALRSFSPHAYTVAENWDDVAEYITKEGFSATMNYHGVAFAAKGFLTDHTLPRTQLDDMLRRRREAFSDVQRIDVQNLMDSHETDRLASMIENGGVQEYIYPEWFDHDRGTRDTPAYRVRKPNGRECRIRHLVALFQMLYVRAPMVYYGTEAGMWGADDPDDRMPMLWPDLTYEVQAADPLGRSREPDSAAFDSTLLAFYHDLIRLRREHEVLLRGTFATVLADDDRSIYAFCRADARGALVIVLNRNEAERTALVPGVQADGLVFASAPGNIHLAHSDGLRLPPPSGFREQAR